MRTRHTIGLMVGKDTAAGLLDSFRDNISDEQLTCAEKSRASFEFFAEDVMERKDKSFHKRLRRMLQNAPRGLVLFPRGFGKSTIVCVDFPLWAIARNRDIRIIIATNAQRLGMEWLREIEWHMLYNEKYRTYFGNMVPPHNTLTWTDTEKIVLGRSSKATHNTLYVIGLGGSALGKRADVLIADDIFEPEEGIPNEAAMERVKQWFWKIFYPIREPVTGRCFVIGTRFHPMDLYGDIMDKAGWPPIIQEALDSSGRSTWSERFPTEELKSIRDSMGSVIFNLQYQNTVHDFSGALLKADWLQTKPAHMIPKDLLIYQGVDPSFSSKGQADYFAMFTVGFSPSTQDLYLLDLIRMRLSPLQQVEEIQKQWNIWRPVKLGIETNVAQVLLKDYLEENSGIRVEALPSTQNKQTRFLRASALFESGRAFLRGNHEGVPLTCFNPFISEWVNYPTAKNDDTLDALEKALSLAIFSGPAPASGLKEAGTETESADRYNIGRKEVLLFGHQRYLGRLFPSVNFFRNPEREETVPGEGEAGSTEARHPSGGAEAFT